MLVETDVAPEVRLFTTESHPQLVRGLFSLVFCPFYSFLSSPSGRPLPHIADWSSESALWSFLRHGFYLCRPTQEGEVSHQRQHIAPLVPAIFIPHFLHIVNDYEMDLHETEGCCDRVMNNWHNMQNKGSQSSDSFDITVCSVFTRVELNRRKNYLKLISFKA